MGQNDRQSTDIRLIRQSLAVILQHTARDGGSHLGDTTGPLWVHGCPYRGLLPFEETDIDVFYGRERLTAELTVQRRPAGSGGGLVVVTGASGAGKSSLLRAGPAADAGPGADPGIGCWPRMVMTPTRDPLGALAAASPRSAAAAALAVRDGPRPAQPGQAHLVVRRRSRRCRPAPATSGRRETRRPPGADRRPVRAGLHSEPWPGREAGRQVFITALCAARPPVGPAGPAALW